MKNMRFFPVVIFSIICLLCMVNISFSQQTAGQLFEKALYVEEAKGELQQAIDLYQKVLKQYPDNRSVAAKALLHVGLCYEKLGKNEAQKAYHQLVNKFPDQQQEVAVASERLSRLKQLADEAKKAEKAPLIPKFQKIEIPTKPGNGVLSPDGKKLAYISEKSLWIVPVHGKTNPNLAGEPVRVTGPMDAWDIANMGTVWSSNGKWLAFYAAESGEDVIYIISANRGNPIKVSINPPQKGGYDYRMSLSPDGKMLAFVNRDDNNNSFIYTISTQGGTQNNLTGPGTREPAFSPDGKLIAYVKTKPDNDLGDEIWVIPATGGEPVLISDDADIVKSPIWSPDGSMIAFLARKYEKGWANNSNELWIAAIDRNGKPTGLITKTELSNSTTLMLAGWSPDNKIGIWLSKPEKNLLYTVPATGGQAMQVTSKNSWIPCWSPDGKYLYFDGINTDNFAGLESVQASGGEVSRIPVRFKEKIQPEMPIGGISVSPDGKKIVFEAYYNNSSTNQKKLERFHHIITVPVNGGSPYELTTNTLVDGYPVWSPDGRHIAFLHQEDKNEPTMNIYTITADGDNLKKVTSLNDSVTSGRIGWSPDGKWIGFFSADSTIKIIPSEGGNTKIVLKDVDIHSHFGLSFSPDGDKIAYSNKEKLYVADLSTGKRVEIRTGLDAIPTMPAWSPDGEKIAFSAYHKGETDLWFMENFLPLEKLTQKTGNEKEPEGIRIRQIWKSPYLDDIGTVSYDGRFRSYVDWGVGNVGIHDLMTDEKKVLTDDANLGDSWQYAENTIISRDGNQIAYAWSKPYNTTALQLIDVDNPKTEILYKKTGEELYPSAWLSDSEIVAFRFIPDARIAQLVVFNIVEKKIKVKKSFIPGHFGGLACSPDGKYLAYGLASNAENGNLDIRLLQADGDGDIPLITHPSNDRVLGWVPGRNEFLFISDRSGSWDLWAIKLDGTKPSGPAKRIYTAIGEVDPLGFTRDGKCYFGFVRRNFYSGLAPFNTETGKIDLESGQSLESQKYGITWSPDGQYLAYIKIEDRSMGNPLKLFVQDVKTGKEYQPDDNMLEISSYSWSPDGNSLLVRGHEVSKLQEEGYKGGVFMVDVNTDRVDQIFLLSDYEYNIPKDDSDPLSWLEWAPDGKSFYYLFQKDRLVQHNLETGEDEILYKYSDFMPYVLEASPNGKNLLFGLEYSGDEKGRLVTMPAEGGKEETLCTAQEAKRIEWAKYSPDGKYIYFVELPEGTKSVLWRVLAEGGNPEKLWSPENRVEIYDIHPDGNQVAFSIRERATEVRVIENLVQELEKIDKASE